MRILITGGTGFLGRALSQSLQADRHEIVALSRFSGGAYQGVRYVTYDSTDVEVAAADAVVNLAGAGIADQRWTDARKRLLRDSRLTITKRIVTAIERAPRKPSVLISGSAIGYYGSSLTETFTESAAPGSDFLATLCADWEAAAQPASAWTRVVSLRTGLVLGPGGLLKKMMPAFQMFVGGPIGTGRQWMSWIHIDDWVALVTWALTASISGPLNATALQPVTNAEFSRALGAALHRPSWLPMPAAVLRVMFGELADIALMASQNAPPAAALSAGFQFKYAGVREALIQSTQLKSAPSNSTPR